MKEYDFSFAKSERLKHRKLFEALFTGSNRHLKHPLLCLYQTTTLPTDEPIQVGFAVPKKHFKTAVERNQIKRWLREAYRQNANPLKATLAAKNIRIAVLFITLKSDNISYDRIRDKMVLLLRLIEQDISHDV